MGLTCGGRRGGGGGAAMRDDDGDEHPLVTALSTSRRMYVCMYVM